MHERGRKWTAPDIHPPPSGCSIRNYVHILIEEKIAYDIIEVQNNIAVVYFSSRDDELPGQDQPVFV